MTPSGKLLAWIKPRSAGQFVAAFVGEGAAAGMRTGFAGREPAVQLCGSPDEARRWIEDQAAAFALPIEWVSEAPGA
jgi:hypothetical protein